MKENLKKLIALSLTFVIVFSAAQLAKASDTGIHTEASQEELIVQMNSDASDDFESYSKFETFYYEIINDEVTIVSCDSDEAVGEVVIPMEIEGYPVTVLADNSFYYCNRISKLTIPPTVTTIGNYAFGCEYDYDADLAFESIFIPASVTSIGYNAFYECDYLKEIIVSKNNLYFSNDEHGVLFNKDKTKLIKYPSGKDIVDYVIPEGVELICDSSFDGSAINNLYIPSSVSEMVYLSNQTKFVTVDSENEYFSNDDSGVLFDKKKTKLICYPAFSNSTSYNVPESVNELEISAFYGAENLESVELADNIRKIDYCTFYGCVNLKNITLPEKLRVIGEYAFQGCNSLESFIVPYGVVRVDYYAFRWCNNLKYVHLTEDVTNIGERILDEIEGDVYICSDTEDCYAKEYAEEYGYEFRLCDGHGLVKPESTTYPDISVPSTNPDDESTTNPDEEPTTRPSTNYEGELTVSIRIPSTTTVKYGDSIILYVDTACRLPADTKIVWTASNDNFVISETSKDGRCCKITPKKSGTTTFTVSLVDSNGNVLDTDTQEMTSKACCFYKIISFFKKIFCLTKTIPQIYKGVF